MSFQTCDRFVWTFGDGKVVEAFAPNISYKFPAPGARTVQLTVRNSFGEASVGPITVPNPSAATCGTGTDRLCLKGGRFRLTIFASDPLRPDAGTGTRFRRTSSSDTQLLPALYHRSKKPEVFQVLDSAADPTGLLRRLTDLHTTSRFSDTQTGITVLREAGV